MPSALATPDVPVYKQILGALTGGASSEEYVDPNRDNYQIGGMGKYQTDMTNVANRAYANPGLSQLGSAASLLGNTAQGHGPSLARETLASNLGSINAGIQAQSMANQGNIGAGVSQRNMLNAQVAAANNAQMQARQASVAEQLGAMGQYSGAASALTQGNLNANNQAANAYQGQYGANLDQTNANMAYDKLALTQSNERAGVDNAMYKGAIDKATDIATGNLKFGMK